jgi:hypothetical protein
MQVEALLLFRKKRKRAGSLCEEKTIKKEF